MLPKEPKPALYAWSEVWTGVLTKPSVATFTEILRDPQATLSRGYLWLYITATISGFLSAYSLFNNPQTREALFASYPGVSETMLQQALLTTLICVAPFVGLISLLLLSVFVAAVLWLATQIAVPNNKTNPLELSTLAEPKPLHQQAPLLTDKTKRFEPLLYVFSAIISPVNILSLLLLLVVTISGVPLLEDIGGVVSLLLTVYQVFLMWLAVQAVFALKPAQAAIALGIPTILSFGFMMLMFMLFFVG